MKKRFILLFIFALIFISFISLASANIVFNNDFATYNIGDVVNVDGYVESTTDVRDVFRLYLECGNSIQVFARTIDLDANKRYFFSQDVTLPFGSKGQCNFKATFNGETQLSEKFEISDGLKGNIFVNKKSFKLGEVLSIEGDISYLDNDKFNGIGIFSLVREENSYLVDTLNVIDGSFLYSTNLENLPPTTYELILEAYDSFGNTKKFNLGTIEVSDKLSVNSYLDKKDYLPGENLDINLKINEASREYRVNFNFENEITEQPFEGTEFNYLIKTKNNIKSGQHTLNIKVTDEYGNYYNGILELNIIPVATRLDVSVDSTDYLPENKVNIFSAIYDQADDLYEDATINIKVLDTKKNEKVSSDINSGSSYELDLEKYIAPGSYTIIAQSTNFRKELLFNVKELEAIETYYEGNRLKVINTGNIEISDTFLVYLDGIAVTNFNLRLKPSEIQTYDLRTFIKENKVYELKINFKGTDYEVGQVLIEDDRSFGTKVTGAVVGGSGSDTVFYIIILLIIIILLLLIFYRPGRRRLEFEKQQGYSEGQEKLRKIREEKLIKKGGKKEINKEEAKDFRESMLKRMRE